MVKTAKFYCDNEILEKMDIMAKHRNISRSALIRNILEDYISRREFNSYKADYENMINKCLSIINKNTEELKIIKELVGDGI